MRKANQFIGSFMKQEAFSKGGIYDQIDINDYGLCTPEEIFHMEVFLDNPQPCEYHISSVCFSADSSALFAHVIFDLTFR